MMIWKSLLLFLFISIVFSGSTLSATTESPQTTSSLTTGSTPQVFYTILAPRIIRPYSTYSVAVNLEPNPNSPASNNEPIAITARIVSNLTTLYSSRSSTPASSIVPGASTVLIPISVAGFSHEQSYNLTIEGRRGQQLIFEDVSPIQLQSKSSSLFIQTDKVIYKPGETIKFRILVLDRTLVPFSSSTSNQTFGSTTPKINIVIFDSRRNVIKSWKGASVPASGLYSSNLSLSSEPVLGDWSLEVSLLRPGGAEILTENKQHIITIDQYVLPKFNVVLNLPPFVTFNNSKVLANIKAAYTYGKVIGDGEAWISISYGARNYYNSAPPLSVVKNIPLVNGLGAVEFDLVPELNLTGDWERRVRFDVTVLEKLTGKRQNASSNLPIYKFPFKLQLLPGAENYKPGFPLNVTIRVSSQDDTPISDPRPDALVIRHGFSYEHEGSIYKFPIPANGLVSFSFATPSNENLNIHGFEGTYKGLKQWFSIPEKITTESKTYLQLKVQEEVTDGSNVKNSSIVSVGQSLIVHVTCNKPIKSPLYYQLVGSGTLLNHGRHVVAGSSSSKETQIKLDAIPASASPTSTLIVYMISSDESSELIADSLQLHTTTKLNNYLNLQLSNSSLEPGQSLTIGLDSKPDSLIALRGVDSSVLLLKEDKDLDLAAVNDELAAYNNDMGYYYGGGGYGRYYGGAGGSFTYRVFHKAGLVLLTNTKIHKPFSNGYGWGSYHHAVQEDAADFATRPAAVNKIAFSGSTGPKRGSGSPSSSIRVRSHFPETWLWEEVSVSNVSQLVLTVPDTLTSWHISGYSIHSQHGLGLVDAPSKLTVIRPFFITLNVPYSAVAGEVVALQVLVHNYLEEAVDARVALDTSLGQFILADQDPALATTNETASKPIRVAASDVGSITFIIIPSTFGPIQLSLKGTTGLAGDALTRPLLVKPPGQQITVNTVRLLDHRSQSSSKLTLAPIFPDSPRVAGADSIKISFVSDILGPTISNLDQLLKLPTGCGEQNLVSFVPDIVILDYLTATKSLTPAIKSKALRFLESGYQRQLTYVHDDGSFSAFGNSDQYGSTWLTAFVLKSFASASRYITVDEAVMRKGLDFLSSQQFESNGSFREPGRVLHSGLAGGSSSEGIALTAYTLLTFVEVQNRNFSQYVFNQTKYGQVMQRATEFLITSTSVNVVNNDTYGLVLTNYVLQLLGHSKKEQIWSAVEKVAITSTDGELKHWEQPPEPEVTTTTTTPRPTSGDFPIPRPYKKPTKPVSVEMSSYQLLSYMHSRSVNEALPIVKWLLTKRNAEGGFISTQDTVVGLAALGKFAAQLSSKELDLQIVASYGGGNETKTIGINRENSIVLQSYELPNITKEVTFESKGTGVALIQLTNSYYVERKEGEEAFNVIVKVTSPSIKELTLQVCTSYPRNDKSPSNMAIVEVNLPTGYIFDSDQLDRIRASPKVMRTELTEAETQLNIYYDSLNSEPSCLNLNGQLIYRVAKQSPSFVQVYDYYDTTRAGKAFYEASKVELCEQMKATGADQENCI